MDTFEPIVKTYYDALEEGRILARRCPKCGQLSYPPMPVCQACGDLRTEWAELSGEATLLEFGDLNMKRAAPEMREFVPFRWGEVELAEGPHVTAVILGLDGVDDPRGNLPLPLKADIVQMDGFKTVVFRPVGV